MFAVLLRLLRGWATQQTPVASVASYHQFLLRSADARQQPDAGDALWKEVVGSFGEECEAPLWQSLDEVRWMTDCERENGQFDRATFCATAWSEWVEKPLHDETVPWYSAITRAFRRLHESRVLDGGGQASTVHAFVVANLTDSREAALATVLGRYLATWTHPRCSTVLLAVMVPYVSDGAGSQIARGMGVVGLEDISRNWDFLGYDRLVLFDGRLGADGNWLGGLHKDDVFAVGAQLLFGASMSASLREAVRGAAKYGEQSAPILTAGAAGYRFPIEEIAEEAGDQLLRRTCHAAGTALLSDGSLLSVFSDSTWPNENQLDRDTTLAGWVGTMETLLSEQRTDFLEKVRAVAKDIVGQSDRGLELFESEPIERWPQIAQDLLALTERGLLKRFQDTVETFRSRHVQKTMSVLAEQLTTQVFEAEGADCLRPGMLSLGALRILRRRLEHRTPTLVDSLVQRAETDDVSHEQEIARGFEMLRHSAHREPHSLAILLRALLAAVAVAAVLVATGRTEGVLSLFNVPIALVTGAAAGILVGFSLQLWHVWLHRWNCRVVTRTILDRIRDYRVAQVERVLARSLNDYNTAAAASVSEALATATQAFGLDQADAPSASSGQQCLAVEFCLGDVIVACHEAWNDAAQSLDSLKRRSVAHESSAYLQILPLLGRDEDVLDHPIIRSMLAQTLPPDPSAPLDVSRIVAWITGGEDSNKAPRREGSHKDEPKSLKERLTCRLKALRKRTHKRLRDTCMESALGSVHKLLEGMSPQSLLKLKVVRRDSALRQKVESTRTSDIDAARLRSLAQETFDKAIPQVPVIDLPAESTFYIGTGTDATTDYLLRDGELPHKIGDRTISTNDATIALVARLATGGLTWEQLWGSKGSIYAKLSRDIRSQFSARFDVQEVRLPKSGEQE